MSLPHPLLLPLSFSLSHSLSVFSEIAHAIRDLDYFDVFTDYDLLVDVLVEVSHHHLDITICTHIVINMLIICLTLMGAVFFTVILVFL